jgi:hypothetical protein
VSGIHGGLAQTVTRELRRRWPSAHISSTSAGRGRVTVRLPVAQARELHLAGAGASRELAEAALAELLTRSVRVLEAGAGGGHYAVTLEIGGL